jgi:hypothetical protein
VERALTLAALLAVAGCDGTLLGGDRDAGSGLDAPLPPGTDAGGGTDAPTSPIDTGVEPPIDAGPCGTTLAASLSRTPVAGLPSGAMAFPTTTGGLATAYGSGTITVQRVDGGGARVGPAIDVPGDALWGVAAASDALAVLVHRGDELHLVVHALDGAPIADTRILGGVPHDVTGNEWFGNLLRAGRLDWTGTEWVAYSTVQRLWPDGIQHYGDQLRTFARDGTPVATHWDWGCSHSMEVRLAHTAAGVGAVCSSDCFPDKGVFFMHRTTVFLDPTGNCMGYVQQRLGGAAAVGTGFVVGWTSATGRSSIDPAVARVGDDRSVGPVVWLSSAAGDERELHVGPYGSGAVAAWIETGGGRIVRLDPSGSPIGAVETIDAAAIDGASDFARLSDGDTAWVVGGEMARLRSCE